jgi:fructokinase
VHTVTAKSLWGIDLGGTKIEGVILRSPEEPEVIFRERVPTEADQGYDHLVGQIKKLYDMMCDRKPLESVHLACMTRS